MAANNSPKFNEEDGSNQGDASNSSDEAIEEESHHKFETCELRKSRGLDSPPASIIVDRYNYFKNLHPDMKADAMAVLDSPDYSEDFQRQAMDVFKALKMTPHFEKFPCGKTNKYIIQIDTNIGYDLVFTNVERQVYQDVLSYFREILD